MTYLIDSVIVQIYFQTPTDCFTRTHKTHMCLNFIAGPKNWSAIGYPACGYTMQSPIDILTTTATLDRNLKDFTFVNYDTQPAAATFNMTNSGHSGETYYTNILGTVILQIMPPFGGHSDGTDYTNIRGTVVMQIMPHFGGTVMRQVIPLLWAQ